MASIDRYGICLVSDVITNDYNYHIDTDSIVGDDFHSAPNRCRWVADSSQALLYVKFKYGCLNILDVNKGIFTLKDPIQLHNNEDGNFHNFYLILILLTILLMF